MPTRYPIKDKRTGKTYEMPWDKEVPPTSLDAKAFIDEQENPGVLGKVKDIWNKANTPLLSINDQPLPGLGGKTFRQIKPEGTLGNIGEFAGDTLSGGTSPLSLGLMATTGGTSAAGRLGLGKTAQALAVPGRIAAGGMIGHGAYNVGNPESSMPMRAWGLGEMALGAAGVRAPKTSEIIPPGTAPRFTRSVANVGAEKAAADAAGPMGMQRYRPNLGTNRPGVTEGQFTEMPYQSPYARTLEAGPQPPERLALPPGRETFYAGRNTVSKNLGDIGTSGLTPAEASFEATIPNRYRPEPPKMRIVDNIDKGPLNVNRVDTSKPVAPKAKAAPTKVKAKGAEDVSKRPFAKASDSDIEYLAKTGEAGAIAEAKLRPTLREKLGYLFKSEVGAVGDIRGVKERQAVIKKAAQDLSEAGFEEGAIGNIIENSPRINKSFIDRRKGGTLPEGVSERRQAELMDKFGGQKTTPEPTRDSIVQRLLKNEKGQLIVPGTDEAGTGNLAKTNKQKAKDWSTRRAAAQVHGQFAAQDFKDLVGKPELIDQFQAGDRTGRLADVQTIFDKLYDAEKAAGIKMPKKENYLRQKWEPEFVDEQSAPAVQGGVVPKTPGFAKKSSYATYAEGRAAGLTPKFDDIPSIIADRVRESKVAIANKQFDDYLTSTLQKDPKMTIKEPAQLRFTGPQSKQLGRYTSNVLQGGWGDLGAQLVSKSKNLYLAGGIPGTHLNIHGWNIGRSDYMARGVKAIPDFVESLANPGKNKALLQSQEARDLIKKAIDYGYGYKGESTDTGRIAELLNKNVVGRGVNKAMELGEKAFEKPLFDVYLPAKKYQILKESYDRLLPKMGEEEALRKASDIANDFMGGINKSLRNKTGQNVLQMLVLAPDWAESRINLAFKGVKALAGKEDPIYAKALGRGGIMRGAGAAAQLGLDNRRGDKPADLTSVGLGKTESGKYREAPIYGTAVEGLRLPEEAIRGAMTGDFSPVSRIVRNRLSQPVQSAVDVIYNQDAFGNPLSGKTKYNQPIPFGKAALNYLNEFTAPLQPQQLQSLGAYLEGKQGTEESISQALELPMRYSTPRKTQKRRTRSRSR